MTYDSRTYVPHNLKGLLSSEQDQITGVLMTYDSRTYVPHNLKGLLSSE
jgi:DNA polymerase IIIc chi subunit